jgi:putative SOS response-associated peptidase YedK
MCGRYTLTISADKLAEQFRAIFSSSLGYSPRYNAAPSQKLPVITNQEPGQINLYRWGLIPHWAKDISIGNKMINARSETIIEKPSFKTPFKKQRCLVLADGYYEWKKSGSAKVPFRITLKDEKAFAIAGLWESWRDEKGEEIRSFTIITTAANPFLAEIHERMPVILPPESTAKWLDNKLSQDEALSLLQPYPEKNFQVYQVSPMVNSPVNDGPELIKAVI